ncbi:MAG: nuclear transport factor 2 family protein [Bacteroidota bacterium]
MEDLITKFYTAFTKRDAETMAACYHDEAVFHDPAFGELQAEQVRKMWEMLLKNGKDLYVEFSNVKANEQNGSAHWEATYSFGPKKRKVHNVIEASFMFKDGKIYRHIDRFPVRKWAKQALGFQGWLLGGTGFFKKRLQKQTAKQLQRYIEKAS